MKRMGMLAVVCAALVAGFAGSLLKDALVEPAIVQAQAPVPAAPIKIGLLDLGKACKASKKFNTLKVDWDAARLSEEDKTRKYLTELETSKDKLRGILQSGVEPEEANFLRPEIAAMDKFIEKDEKRSRAFLNSLLEEYQKQVLLEVRGAAENYCKAQGYHLCLQDYELDIGGADELFKGASFAERWLSKPVLFAPGIAVNMNPYVKDITADIINLVK